MKISLYLFLLFLLSHTATSQRRFKIYHVVNPDSSISILGENHEFVPLTIPLSIEVVNMRSTQPLLANTVFLSSKEPRLVATLIPERRPYSFKYKVPSYQLGIYTGHAPDTSYVYSLPFKLNTGDAMPLCNTKNTAAPGNRYPYFFSLPAGAAICAARAGIVATVRQDAARAKGARVNFIIVSHEDGGVAWYQNLQKNGATVKVGQHVAEGDTLGYLSSEKQYLPLFFDVEYPGEITPQAVPVTFRVGDRLVRLHQH